MWSSIKDFLEVCGAPLDLMEEDGEVGLIIEGEAISLVQMSETSFFFEAVVAELPFEESKKHGVLSTVLEITAASVCQAPDLVAISQKMDDLLLQRSIPVHLKAGRDIMVEAVDLLSTLRWWRSQLGITRKDDYVRSSKDLQEGSRSGEGLRDKKGSTVSKEPPPPVASWG